MGALVALLRRDGNADPRVAIEMMDAAPHRGVPGEPRRIGGAVVGVTAGGTIDDAEVWADTRSAVAFAGALDNLDELREVVRRAAPTGQSLDAGVASTIARAYALFGVDLPTRLRGAYACVITDGRRLVAFRDHLGLATLFYRADEHGVYVATEAKQVVAGAGIPSEPDLDVLEAIFYSDYDDDTPGALRGTSRLPKAVVLDATRDRVRTRRYWRPEDLLETTRMSDDEVAQGFHHLLEQAVDRSLGGDDVLALSGGIDSPALAAYAAPVHRRRTGRPLAALSAVYPHMPSCDETPYIELVARDLGMDLHTFQRERPTMDGLQEWVRLFDGPAPQWTVSQGEEFHRKARSLGFRTIMTGEIAEFVIDARQHVVDHLLLRGRLLDAGRYLGSQRRRGMGYRFLAREVVAAIAPRPVLALYLRARHPKDVYRPAWLSPLPAEERPHYRSYLMRPSERWRVEQLGGFRGPGLSMEADSIAQEVNGVRTRRPWADVDLWEFFLRMRAETKFPRDETKGLVRRLLRGRVPDAILDRTDKTHFNEYIMTGIDYPGLRKWLVSPEQRIRGVDYTLLRERLDAEDLSLYDYIWARDLAAVHAFLALW